MRPLLVFAAVAMIASTASLASAEPPCATPCVVEAVPPLTPTKMRSIPVFVTGIFFVVVGGAAKAGGIAAIAATPDCRAQIGCSVGGTLVDVVGVAAIAAGAIFLSIGIPLTIVGGKTVPDVQKTGMTGSPLLWRF